MGRQASAQKTKEWIFAAAAVAAATLCALLLRPVLAPVNLAMIYVLATVAVAARSHRNTSVATALASVAAFDFFCVPPYLTFAIDDFEYLFTFAGLLAVALAINTLTERIRRQAAQASAREARASILYRISDRLANETRVFDVASVAAALTAEVLSAQAVIFPVKDDRISFRSRTSDHLPVPEAEETIAQWVFRHGRKAGLGVEDLIQATALYVPLRGANRTVGVMAIVPEAGKPDPRRLERYLRANVRVIPRTTFRYAIERFSDRDRRRLLAL